MASSNLAGMNTVCDAYMGRSTIVSRMEFELASFTQYLDYDFGTHLKIDGNPVKGLQREGQLWRSRQGRGIESFPEYICP